MTKNYMEDVAKLLGVELNEEFEIEGFASSCMLTKCGLSYWSDNFHEWIVTSSLGELLTGEKRITKLPELILDEKEEEYLSNIIKPFKDSVVWIAKYKYDDYDDSYFIQIKLVKNNRSDFISLPCFEGDTMYKGMRINKEYTLAELGL